MKITYVKNRLRDALEAAPKMTAESALMRTETLLAAMEGDCLSQLDALLARFPRNPSSDPEQRRQQIRDAYDTARQMIGAGTIARLPEMDYAAKSLCDAADGLLTRDSLDWEPIRIHVDALLLLRRPELPADARKQLLDGLDALRARVAPAPPKLAPAKA